VFDVGANIGAFSLAAAAAGWGRILSFEPIPSTFARLEANIALNPGLRERIQTRHQGLSDREGVLAFEVMKGRSEQASLKSAGADAPGGEVSRFEVEVRTVDGVAEAEGIGRIDLLKADVEGFEVHVLRGAARMLAAGAIHCIMLEIIQQALEEAGTSLDELCRLLQAAGYEPCEAHAGQAPTPMGFDRLRRLDSPTRNYLFVSRRLLK